MSTRRDLYLLMLTYSNHKDHLDAADLQHFLEVEQKVRPAGRWLAVTSCSASWAWDSPAAEASKLASVPIFQGASHRGCQVGGASDQLCPDCGRPGLQRVPQLAHDPSFLSDILWMTTAFGLPLTQWSAEGLAGSGPQLPVHTCVSGRHQMPLVLPLGLDPGSLSTLKGPY